MQIAGVLCAGVALLSALSGLRALTRPHAGSPAHVVSRMVAPAQLAAAVMLAAAAVVTLAGPPRGAVVVLIICAAGAVGTLAAGSWQGARYVARRRATTGCGGGCACSQSCH